MCEERRRGGDARLIVEIRDLAKSMVGEVGIFYNCSVRRLLMNHSIAECRFVVSDRRGRTDNSMKLTSYKYR